MSTPTSLPAWLLACIRDVVEDPTSLLSESLKEQTQWRNIGHGRTQLCTIPEEGGEVEPFVSRILGVFDPDNCYFKPDGGYQGPGEFKIVFTSIKGRGVIIGGGVEEIEFHMPDYKAKLRGITTDDSRLKEPEFVVAPGSRLSVSLTPSSGGVVFRFAWMQGPHPDDEDRTQRARAQEEENAALGDEYRTRNVPATHQAARDGFSNVVESREYAWRPLPVWKADWTRPLLRDDLEDGRTGGQPATAEEAASGDAVPTMERVRPAAYDRVLRGATVDLRFTITRQYIKSSKTYMFLADIVAIYVLRERPQVVAPKRAAGGSNFLRSKRVRID